MAQSRQNTAIVLRVHKVDEVTLAFINKMLKDLTHPGYSVFLLADITDVDPWTYLQGLPPKRNARSMILSFDNCDFAYSPTAEAARKAFTEFPAQFMPGNDMGNLKYLNPEIPLFSDKNHYRLSAFDYIWHIEYDVTYTGNWEEFFAKFDGAEQDLIGAYIQKSPEAHICQNYWELYNWEIRKKDKKSIFGPVFRISRRLYEKAMLSHQAGQWQYYEQTFPSIAAHNGYTIADLNIFGRIYNHRTLNGGTYWEKWPQVIPESQDMLFHPVKTADLLRLFGE